MARIDKIARIEAHSHVVTVRMPGVVTTAQAVAQARASPTRQSLMRRSMKTARRVMRRAGTSHGVRMAIAQRRALGMRMTMPPLTLAAQTVVDGQIATTWRRTMAQPALRLRPIVQHMVRLVAQVLTAITAMAAITMQSATSRIGAGVMPTRAGPARVVLHRATLAPNEARVRVEICRGSLHERIAAVLTAAHAR